MRRLPILIVLATLVPATQSTAFAQEPSPCRFICELQWKFEPTFTIENLANRHRIVRPDGVAERVTREHVFETILALDMKTKLPRLGFTVEALRVRSKMTTTSSWNSRAIFTG